ncbi:hypothetical protein ACVWXQ_008233 [Bradyrhizobium sp. S3.14.4]
MTSDPEESVRLQGFGEMTLRTAVATLMALAPRERSDAAIFRVRDDVRLASSEIAELASDWGMTPMAEVRSPSLVPRAALAGHRSRHGARGATAGTDGGVPGGRAGRAAVVY